MRTIARAFLAPLLASPLLLGGCAAGLTLTTIQETSSKPSNVALYFRVDDSEGEPLPGLTADQFKIYEDEKLVSTYESKQTILNPEVAAAHYTLLLVDMSGSVAESDQANAVVEAAGVFAQQVGENNRVAIYAFDGSEELYKISGFTELDVIHDTNNVATPTALVTQAIQTRGPGKNDGQTSFSVQATRLALETRTPLAGSTPDNPRRVTTYFSADFFRRKKAKDANV